MKNDSFKLPDFAEETLAHAGGLSPVVGIDEAGRGPWAGPVVAAAVILKPNSIPAGLNDSKKLDEKSRELLFSALSASGAIIAVGIADVTRIERMNILHATMWAMADAVRRLSIQPAIALVDGNRAPALPCATRTLIGGDARSVSIAAASIVAKVTRDRIMTKLASAFPDYGFERHKGYGTPQHRAALISHGITPEHRRGWRPVQAVLGSDGTANTNTTSTTNKTG